jgi:hypothetical protein
MKNRAELAIELRIELKTVRMHQRVKSLDYHHRAFPGGWASLAAERQSVSGLRTGHGADRVNLLSSW